MSSHILIDRPIRDAVSRRQLKLWPVVTFPLSLLAALGVNSGPEGFRWIGLGAIAWSIAIPLLVSLEAGMFAMMLFEPLRGFLRRAQYLFLPYSQSDPIHLITPVVTLMAFAMLLHRRKLGVFRGSLLASWVSVLGLIYLLQIFNPLQGGITVGLSGALFMLIPMAWFYFGETIKPKFLETAMRLIVVLGILTSLYGVYQLLFGFPNFEQYWIEHTEFYDSISLGGVKRALATFSSAEEWGRYIQIGALIAFGFGASASTLMRRASWVLAGAALSGMLLLTGQRTAMFGLILGVVVLIILGAKNWRSAIGRILLPTLPMLLVFALVEAPTNDDMLSHGEDDRVGTVVSHTARGTLNPTDEGSLQERLTNWTYLATDFIPYRPLGIGLGGTTVAAWRADSHNDLPPIDSYIISTIITCGVPAALLFVWILLRATRASWRSYRSVCERLNEANSREELEEAQRDVRLWRVAATLMPVLILNSFFGNTFTIYSVAPVAWLLVGWISASSTRKAVEPEIETYYV